MSMTIQNNDLGNVVIEAGSLGYKTETLTPPAVTTLLEGTLLARKAVADAIVADGTGNTGDGTCTLTTVVAGSIVPLVGVYVLTCTAAVTNGGVFKLVDPNGLTVAENLTMTPGAGGVTPFTLAGMTFTLTDDTTDFIVGDAFSLTVAADGTVVVFATDGAGGAQIPKNVLTYEIVTVSTAAIPARILGSGVLNQDRLVIYADGDATNITDAILDQLRDYTMLSQPVQQLSVLDNQ